MWFFVCDSKDEEPPSTKHKFYERFSKKTIFKIVAYAWGATSARQRFGSMLYFEQTPQSQHVEVVVVVVRIIILNIKYSYNEFITILNCRERCLSSVHHATVNDGISWRKFRHDIRFKHCAIRTDFEITMDAVFLNFQSSYRKRDMADGSAFQEHPHSVSPLSARRHFGNIHNNININIK